MLRAHLKTLTPYGGAGTFRNELNYDGCDVTQQTATSLKITSSKQSLG